MYISCGAKCSNLHKLCTVPGSGSRFRFLYRCIVVSLYRFLVVANFQEENKKLKESLDDISIKHNNLLCVVSDLNTRIKDLENERSSLLTAIKLISCDRDIHAVAKPIKNLSDSAQSDILTNPNESSNIPVIDLEKNKENEIANNNTAPEKPKYKGKGKKKSKHRSSINCDNDSSVNQQCGKSPANPSNKADITNQADHDDNYHNNSIESHSIPGKQNTTMNTTKSDKKVTVIAGDSIVKNLQGWRLSDTNNHVVVKSFAGATIEDMEDYLKPIIRKRPESIILHVGTNDLKNLSPKQVAEGFANLGSQINEESPNTNIVISSIILRTDNPQLAAKATEANKLIYSLCSKNKWKFINHSSINSTCLNSRGLHLNRKGTSYIAKNLSQFITSQ